MKYIDVIIDNKSKHTDSFFTYACSDDKVREGQKVYVPFGKGNKIRTAYVFCVKDELSPESDPEKIKSAESLDTEICLTREMLDTALFMTRRYLCKTIEAVSCFTPAGSPSKRGKKRVPYAGEEGERGAEKLLTEEQQRALAEILPYVKQKKHGLFLLHGVTGSGKTEVYMRVIAECVKRERTAIMLVPEISLTKQIIERFFGRFGTENIAVLHSRLAAGERYDEWMRIRRGDVKIVIGARSAVFAPLENIGAVILDEEHESSYKSDMAPKYDTAEIAIKRAKAYGGIVIAGSATPSVNTYKRAEEGIYHIINIKERYNKIKLPLVETVDMRKELAAGNKSVFSGKLHREIASSLENGRQVILFLNRRGYSTFISCRECGYVMKCPDCGISMVYHKNENKVVCHYCGRQENVPALCPDCGSRYIKYFGMGTEKLEEETAAAFPNAKTARLDLDTISRKGSIDRILNDFEDRKTDILIGTQIVAKGLDFANVGLVGIISADISLNIPDFRSAEKTFQLITQAAGRAGRGEERGHVIVQTYSPEHYAVTAAAAHDYEAFYRTEIKMRKLLGYPPYADMMQIVVSSAEESDAQAGANLTEALLRRALGDREALNLMGNRPAPIGKASGRYRYHMILKCPKGKRPLYTSFIDAVQRQIIADKKNKFNIYVDINPYSFM
mgnify:FL=1